jgi:hypothetical protein
MAKTVLYTGLAATFRILGAAATPHVLFTIENTTGSTRVVGIRRLVAQMDATVVLTTVMPLVKTYRCASIPSGGTAITKGTFDTTQSTESGAHVTLRGAGSSDGGTATAITASTTGGVLWEQYAMRLHTAVGQVLAPDNSLVPILCDTTSFVLRANEAIMVQVEASAGSANPATNHWFVQCVWEEYTE